MKERPSAWRTAAVALVVTTLLATGCRRGEDEGGLPAPALVRASQNYVDRVEIWWSPVPGAESYAVLRDGEVVATDLEGPPFSDHALEAGRVTADDLEPAATQGVHPDRVVVRWHSARALPGPDAAYQVIAVAEDEESPPSPEAVGRRSPPTVTGYEIAADDGPWIPVDGWAYVDPDPPEPQATPGVTSASSGDHSRFVALSLGGFAADVGERRYVVRATSTFGPGEPSEPVIGYRRGDLTFHWQRAPVDAPEAFETLDVTLEPTYFDTSAPTDGTESWYRAVVHLDEAEAGVAEPDLGHRHPSPSPHVRDDVWTPIGLSSISEMSAMVVHDDVAYLAGAFDYVGPAVGHLARIGRDDGEVDRAWPRFDGSVRAIVRDEDGGFIVVGAFRHVDGIPRERLVRITSAGIVDADLDVALSGTVHALAVAGQTLFVGGQFTEVNGLAHRYLVAVDLDTGEVLDWAPEPSHQVNALRVAGGRLYVGGRFTRIGDVDTNRLAAIRLDTLAVETGWTPDVNHTVLALEASEAHDLLFAGGIFDRIDGETRESLAAFDVSVWPPAIVEVTGGNGSVSALHVDGDRLYVGGSFLGIGGEERERLAAFTLPGLVLDGFDPGASGLVNAIAKVDDVLYVGGAFTELAGEPRAHLGAVTASGVLTDWDPDAESTVRALASDGDAILAGGDLQSVGGERRERMVAIDLSTGRPTDWSPPPISGGLVTHMTVGDGVLYVAGGFSSVDGEVRRRVAALDLSTGALTDWNPGLIGGHPRSLLVHEGTVWVGGDFDEVGGEARPGLAAIAPDGEVLPLTVDVHGDVLAVALDATRLFVAERPPVVSFDSNPIVWLRAFDRATGDTFWKVELEDGLLYEEAEVKALLLAGDALIIAGVFDRVGEAARHLVAEVDPATGLPTENLRLPMGSWRVHAVAVDHDRLYVGGYFTLLGEDGVHANLVGLETETDLQLPFRPSLDHGVTQLHAENGRVVVGGRFRKVDGVPRGMFAVFEP